MAEAGDLNGAAAAFEALGDYEDAATQRKAMVYRMAEQAAEAGQVMEASALYEQAGDYQDAADQAIAVVDAVYGPPAEEARAAAEEGRYARTAYLLSEMDFAALPERYADLAGLYEKACYQAGMALLDAGNAEAAYPYLQRCAARRDVAECMNRTAWRILGTWTDGKHELILRGDGTCAVDGAELLYRLDGYNIETGETTEQMTVTHKLTSIREMRLYVRDVRDGDVALTLDRKADSALLPLPEAADELPAAEAPVPQMVIIR